MLDRVVSRSVIINASKSAVWKHLTDPNCLQKALFGAEVKTNWKVGSPIRFSGQWKGRDYEGRGEITRLEKEEQFEYTYYSNLSGQPDSPEHYCRVSYCLGEKDNQTVLSVTQTNIPSQADEEEISAYWETVLGKIRNGVETRAASRQALS